MRDDCPWHQVSYHTFISSLYYVTWRKNSKHWNSTQNVPWSALHLKFKLASEIYKFIMGRCSVISDKNFVTNWYYIPVLWTDNIYIDLFYIVTVTLLNVARYTEPCNRLNRPISVIVMFRIAICGELLKLGVGHVANSVAILLCLTTNVNGLTVCALYTWNTCCCVCYICTVFIWF
jgi:hypothetical protein